MVSGGSAGFPQKEQSRDCMMHLLRTGSAAGPNAQFRGRRPFGYFFAVFLAGFVASFKGLSIWPC
jgi:hypothetical protein